MRMPEISDKSVLLPQPLCPDDGDEFARRNRDRDVLERLGFALETEIPQVDVAQLDLRRGGA